MTITVTGFTADRMLAIENNSVVDGEISGDNLILTRQGGGTIDAGNVRGPQGIQGPTGEVSQAEFDKLGLVGYVNGPLGDHNITGTGPLIDVDDLTVTWTAEATRYYKTDLSVQCQAGSADLIYWAIRDGSNVVKVSRYVQALTTSQYHIVSFFIIETGLSGSQTRKLSVDVPTSKMLTVSGSSGFRGFFSVEDLGVV